MSFFTLEKIPSYFVMLVSQSINNQIWLQDFRVYYSRKVTSFLIPCIENWQMDPHVTSHRKKTMEQEVRMVVLRANLPLFGDEFTALL